MKRKAILGLAISILFRTVSISCAITASFQGLGDLTGGQYLSEALGVSADGSTVVGFSMSASGQEAFRWQGGIMTGLGDLSGGTFISIANAVSFDGSVVVGISYSGLSGGGFEGFRWTQADGMVGLGHLPGGLFYSTAYGVSADGSIIVGSGRTENGDNEAVLWEDGVMTSLGSFLGYRYTEATGVSADGSVIVGYSTGGGDSHHGFIWKDGVKTGLTDLDYLYLNPQDISDDGSVVVGLILFVSGRTEAFRWEDGVVVSLEGLTLVSDSCASAISGNGKIIVGYDQVPQIGDRAFIWDEQNGMQYLQDVLENDYQLDLTGWTLCSADGISFDGKTIAGKGINPDGFEEAWIATIPEPYTVVLLGLGGLLIRK